jgi:hypothetical protein
MAGIELIRPPGEVQTGVSFYGERLADTDLTLDAAQLPAG